MLREVYSGYAGGTTINPNYYQVMSGKTGHAEAIEIIYDSSKVSFDRRLKVFFDSLTLQPQIDKDLIMEHSTVQLLSSIMKMKKKINNYISFFNEFNIW